MDVKILVQYFRMGDPITTYLICVGETRIFESEVHITHILLVWIPNIVCVGKLFIL